VVISRGDVFWVEFSGVGSEPLGRRPAVVVQDDRFNRSAIRTTIVAALTTNLRRAASPGNVQLGRDEAGLPKPTVVNVTQVVTIDRARLAERLGRLSGARIDQVLAGLALVFGLDWS
jgi:mRNA interferase MazF